MSPAVEQVFKTALSLTNDERVQLIEALIASEQTQPPFDESWRAVIKSRSAELDAGTAQELSWSEVRERLRRKVGLPHEG